MPSTDGYPAYFVGQRLTATLLQSGTKRVAYKTASTSRASTTSRTADPDLSLSVEANALYLLEAEFYWTSGATAAADWKGGFTVPASATGAISHASLTAAATALSNTQAVAREITAETSGGVVDNFSFSPTKIHGFLDTAGTAGTLGYTWAQNTSNATGTVLEAYSYIALTRIG